MAVFCGGYIRNADISALQTAVVEVKGHNELRGLPCSAYRSRGRGDWDLTGGAPSTKPQAPLPGTGSLPPPSRGEGSVRGKKRPRAAGVAAVWHSAKRAGQILFTASPQTDEI
jgi:hypothetical protein